ncbi:DUF3095 domain-containing protein [Aggregatilineales bacterium SYSU G02658]
MNMDTTRFYDELPSVDRLVDIVDDSIYHDVPNDWLIAITDVRGSTKAIEAGRYKEVNGLAAASITALLNAVPQGVEIPFVFGGDGATIVFPAMMRAAAVDALIATQRLAREQFDLDLRIGVVPVADVRAAGYNVRVARLRFSENFSQAIFTGGGLSYADQMIKDPAVQDRYLIQDDGQPHEADFSGYECRWSEMPSASEETVSLIVMVTGPERPLSNQIYRDVILTIESIYGDSLKRNPINVERMTPARNLWLFSVETRIRQRTSSLWARLKLMAWTWGGYFLWSYKDKIWEPYKQVVVNSTDREKFDDVLRMIMAGTPLQRELLTKFLEKRRLAGELVYGVHVSSHSLMTCLVFDRFGRQVHFIDGSGGGYALAARQMKAQLAQKAVNA